MVKMFQFEIDAFSASTVRVLSICYYENVLEFTCDDGQRCQTLKVFVSLEFERCRFSDSTHYSRAIDSNKQLKMVTRMVVSLNGIVIRRQCVLHFLAFSVTLPAFRR